MSDFVVQKNAATALLAGAALLAVVLAKPKFATDLVVPLLPSPVSVCASLEVTAEEHTGRTLIDLSRIGNFEVTL